MNRYIVRAADNEELYVAADGGIIGVIVDADNEGHAEEAVIEFADVPNFVPLRVERA